MKPTSRAKLRCFNCDSAMKTRRGDHRYVECGLPDVILKGVDVSKCPSCGTVAAQVPNIEGLHATLARAIAEKRKSLTPAEIRFLRKSLGFSGVDFARIMGKSPETVSRWESAASPMAMDPAAERLLRLMVVTRKPAKEYPLENLSHVAAGKPVSAKLSLRRGTGERWTLATGAAA